MKSDDEILRALLQRFPANKQIIIELAEESDLFKSLCEDYYYCRMALERMNYTTDKAETIRKEYEILLQEIEEELLMNITK